MHSSFCLQQERPQTLRQCLASIHHLLPFHLLHSTPRRGREKDWLIKTHSRISTLPVKVTLCWWRAGETEQQKEKTQKNKQNTWQSFPFFSFFFAIIVNTIISKNNLNCLAHIIFFSNNTPHHFWLFCSTRLIYFVLLLSVKITTALSNIDALT